MVSGFAVSKHEKGRESRAATDLVLAHPVLVRRLGKEEALARIPALSDVLINCVHGGASVSFMAPLSRERADAFWRSVAEDVAAGGRALLVAEDGPGGEIVGTVQLVLAQPENQPHRADVSKMLVRRSARRRGIGAALMRAVEDAARQAAKTLLVLDTASDEAERLYARSGWARVGAVPGYALLPDGRPCDTVYYYKQIG
jgi:GNAT superfamily N-acetyltransferase